MIFYFSGTGNSKWVAENLSTSTNETLVEIGAAISDNIYQYSLKPMERIGFVFPIHSWGPAPIVLRFISRLKFLNYAADTYCYMVCSCGDDIGLAVDMWEKSLPAITPSAAFSIQMPNNYIMLPGFDVDPKILQQEKLIKAKKRIEEITMYVSERRRREDVVQGKYAWLKTRLVYPLFKRFAMSDKKFSCDHSRCSSCGLCAKVCTVKNITLDAQGHPVWNGRCEMCLSCIHRCPAVAIQYGKETLKKGRYHHP